MSESTVPTEFYPGTDLISKIILSDEQVINTITSSLAKAPEDSYSVVPLNSVDDDVYYVLYSPHVPPRASRPLIVINIMKTFSDGKLRSITYQCTHDIYDRYSFRPLCVIIIDQEFEKTGLLEKTTPCDGLPFFREMDCTYWAEKCLLVSSKDIETNKAKDGKGINQALFDIIIAVTSAQKVIIKINT